MTLLWQYFTLILQWLAEPLVCDEPSLHQPDTQSIRQVQSQRL